jgi:hypothetical protein
LDDASMRDPRLRVTGHVHHAAAGKGEVVRHAPVYHREMTVPTREGDDRVREVFVLDGRVARSAAADSDVVSDRIEEIQQALSALERLGSTRELRGEARTALRIRTMALVDRLEIEFGKRRMVEGHFAAPRYHLSAVRERPFTLRLARVALRLAPRLLRAAYVQLRPWVWTTWITAGRSGSSQNRA